MDIPDESMDFFYDLADFDIPPLQQEKGPEEVTQALDEISCDVEGKLFIQLKNLQCPDISKRWYQKLTCVYTVDGFEQKVPLIKIPRGGSYDAEAIAIFDIHEYFGPASITIALQLASTKSSRYTYRSTLHQLVSRQEVVGRSCIENISHTTGSNEEHEEVAVPYLDDCLPHASFWRVRDKILLEPSIPSMTKSNHRSKTKPTTVSCEMFFTYTPMKSYLAANEGNTFRSLVQHGSPVVLCDVLETLSRNNLLRLALAIRTPLVWHETDSTHALCGGGGFVPLEHALIARNKGTVGVLLRRTGNWCFQSTGSSNGVPVPLTNSEESKNTQHAKLLTHLPEFLSKGRYHAPYQVPLPPPSLTYVPQYSAQAHVGCALHAAVMGGHIECLHMLLRFIRKYQSDIVEWRTDSHAKMINWVGARNDGYTPLMLACSLGRTHCIRMLLAEGATLDVATEPYRLTPLMLACYSGSVDAVAHLLVLLDTTDSNLSPTIRTQLEQDTVALMTSSPYVENIDGKQALGIAAEAGHAGIVAHLIEKKVSFSHQDMFGNTALHLAAANAHDHVCDVIIKADAAAALRYNQRNFTLREDVCTQKGKRTPDSQDESADEYDKKELHHADDECEKEVFEKNLYLSLANDDREDIGAQEHSSSPSSMSLHESNNINKPEPCTSLPGGSPGVCHDRPRVLVHMTPHQSILRAVDKRGRTAATVATLCGHEVTANLLLEAALEQQRRDDLYVRGEKKVGDCEQNDDNYDDDDVADQIAYTFAKTLYFDPKYDAAFSAPSYENCSDSSESDSKSDDGSS